MLFILKNSMPSFSLERDGWKFGCGEGGRYKWTINNSPPNIRLSGALGEGCNSLRIIINPHLHCPQTLFYEMFSTLTTKILSVTKAEKLTICSFLFSVSTTFSSFTPPISLSSNPGAGSTWSSFPGFLSSRSSFWLAAIFWLSGCSTSNLPGWWLTLCYNRKFEMCLTHSSTV